MHTADAREQMIEQQVRAWDVLEARVLEAMRQVPRELLCRGAALPRVCRCRGAVGARTAYVASQRGRQAAAGAAAPARGGGAGDRAGSGFVTACLRAMAAQVRSLEIFPELADAARRNLAALGMRDVEVLDADALNADSGARYDAIAITASLPLYDARFERMLTPAGACSWW